MTIIQKLEECNRKKKSIIFFFKGNFHHHFISLFLANTRLSFIVFNKKFQKLVGYFFYFFLKHGD